jgi:UDP-N-acetylglucosamine--N-acetylmuramyl-(pentapeptide) pyrophosphoryl-undecaprenol N-acetylglucosamine transferase
VTIAVVAAGTGGHVYPALAIGEALVERGMSRGQVVFFGGDRLEATAVPAAGFPFVSFALVRLERSLTPRNLRIPFVLRRTAAAMAAELVSRNTKVVLGMGGYATVPAALAVKRCDIPLFLQEQNAAPGLATRFAARRAEATFLGLPGAAEALPRSILTGNPLRPELGSFDRERLRREAMDRYGIGSESVVLGVSGGSLGARVLNESVAALVQRYGGGPLTVLHLTGREAAPAMVRRAETSPLPWLCLPFEERMDLFYAAVDLLLCRAGAMTVSEVAATRTAAVLVPLERVGQHHNAAALENAGAARVVRQAELPRLPEIVEELLGNPGLRAEMAAATEEVARPHAASVIAAHLLEAAA